MCKRQPKFADPGNVEYFPKSVATFCLDPAGSDKGYGEGAQNPLEGICDLFDGACVLYQRHQVKRVVEVLYVDDRGGTANIAVKLSKFGSDELALSMFTGLIVGGDDPGHPDAPRKVEAGGLASLGLGNANLWKGAYLAEVLYVDETLSADAVKKQADDTLPVFVKELGSRLPGDVALPPSMAALPSAHRLPLGLRFVTKELLDVEGAGSGAYGYYKDGDKRWRAASAVKGDPEQAKDVMRTLAKGPGTTAVSGLADGAIVMIIPEAGGADSEWLIARRAGHVLGIGDEPRVLRAGMSRDEFAQKTLTRDAKRELLAKLLAAD